jgi:hypothetical protein
MIDTDTIVATVTPSSTFEHSPTSFSDRNADDLDRLAASLDCLALCCSEPSVDEAGEQITCESISEQQRFGEAALVNRKQLLCLARFQTETTFSRGQLPAGRAVRLLWHRGRFGVEAPAVRLFWHGGRFGVEAPAPEGGDSVSAGAACRRTHHQVSPGGHSSGRSRGRTRSV